MDTLLSSQRTEAATASNTTSGALYDIYYIKKDLCSLFLGSAAAAAAQVPKVPTQPKVVLLKPGVGVGGKPAQ